MSETTTRTSATNETDQAVRLLDRSLRRLRVGRADRKTITDDVRGDLDAAAAAGASLVIAAGERARDVLREP